ncbi:hypothetical protein E3226_012060 (plasmid) [Legionella geestiana]|uniref:hypothetical protein n=1 Tax=Legionella geestiana TaxID=45065 RepID=UPI0010919FE1|nr:hypothetical protein [Legionella geestiana]QDQ41214.1 hypothetical protein E3226_012060 [Legionella geestiana]
MNNLNLKQAIAADIVVIKGLQPDIIPAGFYYKTWLRLFWGGFWKLWLVISPVIAWSGINNPSNSSMAKEPVQQIISEALMMGCFVSIVAMLLLSMAINMYIQFRFHLEDKLQTGAYIAKRLSWIGYLFFGVFTLFLLLLGSGAESATIFMAIVFSFVLSLLVTWFLVQMELNRIGISTIFAAIHTFFDKRNDNHLNHG